MNGYDVLTQALAWHEAGQKVALATVVETWGSAPNPVGSQMAVSAGGGLAGSVSGGCIEAEVVEAALLTLQTGSVRVLRFGVADDRAWAVGLPCGGEIAVLVEPLR